MPSLSPSVADTYTQVVGIDTHAATHSFAILTAATGAVEDERSFPVTEAGLARAHDWIARRTGGDLTGVLISAEGTNSYGGTIADLLLQAGYRVVEAPVPRRDRGRGKSDPLDARTAARAVLGRQLTELRDCRTGETRSALQVLLTSHKQLTKERTRLINQITALLRRHWLGLDARQGLSAADLATVTAWRARRNESIDLATARAEIVRKAKRIHAIDADIKDLKKQMVPLIKQAAPGLLDLYGVGPFAAATILTVWSHPGRIRSEAAFASMAGASPLPASSGNTSRHRLSREGDRHLNHALHIIAHSRAIGDPDTKAYIQRRTTENHRSEKDAMRCLKRAIARQLYRFLAKLDNPTPITT